jgi:hypothetical protein
MVVARLGVLWVAWCGFAVGARADDRFLLVVTEDTPGPALVASAYRGAQAVEATALPDMARERLARAYPRLFAAGKTATRASIDAELKAARDAHYQANFEAAETHFRAAMDLAYGEPELLAESARLLQQLADAAAVRFRNTLARGRPEPEARGELHAFVKRFLTVTPTSADHPPAVLAEWERGRQAALADPGLMSVSVRPLDLERGGGCRLFVNGGEVATLPLPGPVRIARGEHLVQVQCGLQRGWLQRVRVDDKRVSLVVPVQAMVAARADPDTAGILLVAPEEGDEAGLVTAVAEAAGFVGAVAVRTAVGRMEFGRHDAGSSGATREAVASLIDGNLGAVERVGGRAPASTFGPWPWVIGGVGVAALATGLALNLVYVDTKDSDPDAAALQTPSTVMYVTGGVLVATGIVLLVVDAASSDAPGSARGPVTSAGPGGVAIRF